MAKRIFVGGHRGLVGQALVRRLSEDKDVELVTRTRSELDLARAVDVDAFFANERIDEVYLAAARVGGILANDTFSADFIVENLHIELNVIDAAYRHGVQKLLFMGSSCIYPRLAAQPIVEEALLTGPLEPTNSAYAVAKIAGIELCRAYQKQHGFRSVCLMPSNLYGPGDTFDAFQSHVLPALMMRFHEAKVRGQSEVVVFGTGTPRREFVYVDDVADAALVAMKHFENAEIVNVGLGYDVTIRELAAHIANVVGYRGSIVFDPKKPDGTPQKLLDVSRLAALGWRAKVSIGDGIERTYRWYVEHVAKP